MELEFQKNLDKQTGTYAERLLLDGLFFALLGRMCSKIHTADSARKHR